MKIKNLYFSPVKSLSFNNVDTLEIIKNIGIKNDRIFAFTNNLNFKDIELIKNNPLKREIYKFLSLKKYPELSTATGTEISRDWSVFYWAWWLALAPMVGAFIINISNNKSLRQMILGTILIGGFGCIFSMAILSNLSISLFESNTYNAPDLISNSLQTREEIIVRTIGTLSFGKYILIAFLIICIIFLGKHNITSGWIRFIFKTRPLEWSTKI